MTEDIQTPRGFLRASDRASALSTRSLLRAGGPAAEEFRRALMAVAEERRDAWLDLVFGIDGVADDGPALPRGCVPYLPCSVNVLLSVIEQAEVQSRDVFVDVGSGLGRATASMHLLTGAEAIGIEIQPHLVQASRALAAGLGLRRCSVIEGDAPLITGDVREGSVFFLYCPFSGERLAKLLDGLELIAQRRTIRVCCLDLSLPARPWLCCSRQSPELVVYRSTLLD